MLRSTIPVWLAGGFWCDVLVNVLIIFWMSWLFWYMSWVIWDWSCTMHYGNDVFVACNSCSCWERSRIWSPSWLILGAGPTLTWEGIVDEFDEWFETTSKFGVIWGGAKCVPCGGCLRMWLAWDGGNRVVWVTFDYDATGRFVWPDTTVWTDGGPFMIGVEMERVGCSSCLCCWIICYIGFIDCCTMEGVVCDCVPCES